MKNARRLLTSMAAMVMAAASAVSAVGVAEEMEWPDAYSHATDASSKEVLSGEQLDEALQFLHGFLSLLVHQPCHTVLWQLHQVPGDGL